MILLIFHNFHSMFLQSLDLSIVSFICFFFNPFEYLQNFDRGQFN